MTIRALLIPIATLLGVSGCGDYGLFGPGGLDGVPNGEDSTPNTGDELNWPKTDGEWCNGEDDDGDGLIDESFPDTDGDGIADCMDEDCDVRLPDGSAIDMDVSCAPNDGAPPEDPWSVRIEWAWRGEPGFPGIHNVFTPPMVGSLTDDNWDGRIDELDDPDIVFIASRQDDAFTSILVALDGQTGTPHFIVEGVSGLGGVAVAKVDGDAYPDIVAFDETLRPILINGSGDVVWTAEKSAIAPIPQVTVADLDQDGVVDVIADTIRLRGTDGAILNWFPVPSAIEFRIPAVGDLNLDGMKEVVIGNSLFSPDGQRKWTAPVQGTYGHWSALVDANDDPYGEIVMVADGRLLVLKHDGTVLVDVAAGNDHPGAPCVADFDGDGDPEIGWASNNRFNLHDMDGTVLWSRSVQDGTGLLATCSGFDFDGNGQMEVLYNDNNRMYILEGQTGAVLYSDNRHASTTIWEYPTIADIDNDGSAEVLVASNTLLGPGWAGVTVLGHAADQWMPSGPTWHVHDYMVTNVDEEGSVLGLGPPPWHIHNMYRARPAKESLSIDLQGTVADACFTGCKGDARAKFSVQILNTGTQNTEMGVSVAMYAVSGEQKELLQVQELGTRVGAGQASKALLFDVEVLRLGTDGVLFIVDDDGSGTNQHEECNEDNNEVRWLDVPCE